MKASFRQLAFLASRLRKEIPRKVCSVAVKNSSLLLRADLSLPFDPSVGVRRLLSHSQRQGYRVKAPAWPEWNRPCSVSPRASKSEEFCTGSTAKLLLPNRTYRWKTASQNDSAPLSNLS